MRFFAALLAAALLAGCSPAKPTTTQQPQTNQTAAAPDYRPAITNVLSQFNAAFPKCIVRIPLPAKPGQPNSKIDQQGTYHRVAATMRQIDISACPTDFRLAWIELRQRLENFSPIQNTVAVATAALSSTVAGRNNYAARELSKIITDRDIKAATDNLELAAARYNVE